VHKFEKEGKRPGDERENPVSSQELKITVWIREPGPVFSVPSEMQADSDGGSG